MALDEHNLCEVCDDRIEEPRLAVGLKSCALCAHRDPASPPWDVEPTTAFVWIGYDPGAPSP